MIALRFNRMPKRRWCLLSLIILLLCSFPVYADVYINLLAVNGTDQPKDKDIKSSLPQELTAEDILDTAGLELDYDVNEGAYFVHGTVSLGPKETKTFKIRVRDIWQIEDSTVGDIKDQIEKNLNIVKDTEYYETGVVKQEYLKGRLDYLVEQQKLSAEDIGKRIDNFRVYKKELDEIRSDAVSVAYWRSKQPSAKESKLINYVIELKNPSDKETRTVKQNFYLPTEVKPEHLVNFEGFNFHYDVLKGQPYLTREEELKPGESKKYTVSILDIWSIPKENIEDLKERTRKAYKYLEHTEYNDSAKFLVANIKKNLEKIEAAQAQEQGIKEHISTFRDNEKRLEIAKKDVEALENLLIAVREKLERSRLRNVLERIKSLQSIADIAEAIFGKKPSPNNAWKIITGIVIFVGLFTMIHFAIWGKRSKDVKIKEEKEEEKKKEKT